MGHRGVGALQKKIFVAERWWVRDFWWVSLGQEYVQDILSESQESLPCELAIAGTLAGQGFLMGQPSGLCTHSTRTFRHGTLSTHADLSHTPPRVGGCHGGCHGWQQFLEGITPSQRFSFFYAATSISDAVQLFPHRGH